MPHTYASRKSELKVLSESIRDSVYKPIAPLTVLAYTSKEPLSYNQRMTGTCLNLKVGDKWGDLFDCAWMHFEGSVPKSAIGETIVLLIDVGGEACIFNDDGEPVRGLTNKNSEYAKSLGMPGKMVVPLTRCAMGTEKISIWADAGANDLFGKTPDDGRIQLACVAVQRDQVLQLRYDWEVLEELTRQLPENSAQNQQLLRDLCRASDALSGGIDNASAETARNILSPHLSTPGTDAFLSISAIGHSHMDLGWLWPIRETKRKCARTFATVMRNMEDYPDYVYGASQPQQFQWVKEEYPALYEQIKRRVAEGRFDIQGAMWVEADTNTTSGESLVRQMIYGKRFWQEEFGIDVREVWLPDAFGYSGALPQIMKNCDVDWFMTQKLSWNQVNVFPHHSFWWEGIDGTKVLAHMLPEGNYNSPAMPRSITTVERNNKDSAVSRHALLLFGIGDGGGGPGEEHLERLRREKNLYGLAPVIQERARDFFEKWNKDSDQFVTWQGELYLEMHQGTYTTQARNKRFNRKMELALRDCEMLCALAGRYSFPYPKETLDAIWKETLLYQFHDILPGSSIKRVYDESLPRYEALLADTQKIAADAHTSLAAHLNTKSARNPVVIFNSLSWRRDEWIKISGKWQRVSIPPCGFGIVDEYPATDGAVADVGIADHTIENDILKVSFNSDGSIASVYDKTLQRESMSAPGNRLAIWQDNNNAWDFSAHYRSRKPEYMTLVSSQVYIDGPAGVMKQTYAYGKSTLTQEIRLTNGSRRIDFITHVNWNERWKMLRTSFPTAIHTREAACEIQYGSIRRPTHQNTSWDVARYEVSACKWVDLSEPGYGVALLNDCKYGHCIINGVIDLNLLRSTTYPGEDADICEHDFTYSLLPHEGDHVRGGVVRSGYELNVPLLTLKTTAHDGEPPKSFIEVDTPNVVVEVVKKADASDATVIRLYECHGTQTRCRLKFADDFENVELINMLERPISALSHDKKNKVLELVFRPFEIVTLRIE